MTQPPRFPTSRQVHDQIAAFKSLRWESIEFDDLVAQAGILTKGLVVQAPILESGTKLFRGIVYLQQPGSCLQLGCPPRHIVTSFRRASKPGQPMFYGSVAREPIFFELDVRQGQFVALSRWRVTQNLVFNRLGYDAHVLTGLGSVRSDLSELEVSGVRGINRPANRALNRYLSKLFTRRVERGHEDEYKLSAAIAAFQIKSLIVDDPASFPAVEPRFAGLMYPSLAMRGNSDNVAMLPEFADRYLQLEQVEFIRVDDVGINFTYQVTSVDFAHSFDPDGSILWRGRRGHWTIRPGKGLRISVEHGQWVAHDEHGRVVDFE